MFGTQKLKFTKVWSNDFFIYEIGTWVKIIPQKKISCTIFRFICGLKLHRNYTTFKILAWYQFCQIHPETTSKPA